MITPYRSRPGWPAHETDQWRQGGSNPQPSACKTEQVIYDTDIVEDRWVAPPLALMAILSPWVVVLLACIIGTSDNIGQTTQSIAFVRASHFRSLRFMVPTSDSALHLFRGRTMSRPLSPKAPSRASLGRSRTAPLPSTLEPPSPNGVKFADFRAEIEGLYQVDRANATFLKIRQVLDEWQKIGVETVDQLTPRAITRWLLQYPDRSSATKRSLLSSGRAICSYAARTKYLNCSPFSAWDFFRNLPPDIEKPHHSAEALGKVFAQARKETQLGGWKEARTEAGYAMAALTGMRRSEILWLRTKDLDLANRVIYIVPPHVEDRLKTPASAQPIPCPESLAVFLERWLPISGCECGWIFPNCYRATNRPWQEGATHNKPLEMLRALGERAGVQDLTWHSLRHSWGTHAESLWGLPEMVAQRILRHTTPRTTRRYRHSDLGNLQHACASIRLPGAG